MSVQSVGPKTPAPRREVWDHVQWGVTECGLPVPQGVEFLNEGDESNPLIVLVKVSSADDGAEWAGFLFDDHYGRDSNKHGVFHYGEALGWKWHVDWYGSLPAQVAQQNLPQTAEVASPAYTNVWACPRPYCGFNIIDGPVPTGERSTDALINEHMESHAPLDPLVPWHIA